MKRGDFFYNVRRFELLKKHTESRNKTGKKQSECEGKEEL